MESYISSEIGTRVEADWNLAIESICVARNTYIVPAYLDARMRLHPPLQELLLPPSRSNDFHCKPWDMAKELFDPRERETLRLCASTSSDR